MRLTVNAREYELPIAGHDTLLTVLRERLQLTGTKLACGRGECGACTVLVDGRLAYSCLTLASGCDGQQITTVEGLDSRGTLHPVQQAFIELDALNAASARPVSSSPQSHFSRSTVIPPRNRSAPPLVKSPLLRNISRTRPLRWLLPSKK